MQIVKKSKYELLLVSIASATSLSTKTSENLISLCQVAAVSNIPEKGVSASLHEWKIKVELIIIHQNVLFRLRGEIRKLLQKLDSSDEEYRSFDPDDARNSVISVSTASNEFLSEQVSCDFISSKKERSN